MHFHPKSLLIAIALFCLSSAVWSQRIAPIQGAQDLLQKRVPSDLRVAEHQDTPNSCLNLEWNMANSSWDSSALDSYLYYPNGDRSQMLVSLYNNNAWVDWHKSVYRYDNGHQLIRTDILEWSGTSWDTIERYDVEWDSYGNPTLDMHFVYNGSVWDSSSGDRFTYTYYNGNLVAEQLSESYSSFNHSWSLNERWVYHYTAQNEWDSLTFYYDNSGQWEPYEQMVDVVFHNFAKESFASYRYQQFNGAWEDIGRVHYNFGAFDSYVGIMEGYTGSWDTTGKDSVIMDAEDHVTLQESYTYSNGWTFYDGDIFHFQYDGLGRTTEEMQEYTVNAVYRNGVKRIYDSFFVVGVIPMTGSPMNMQAWPNPVVDVLHMLPHVERPVQAELTLLDLQGRVQHQQAIHLSNAELLLDFPEQITNGAYLLQVVTTDARYVSKIMLMR